MRPRCLVTGASGLLGHVVCDRLASDYDMMALAHRNPFSGQTSVDLRDPESLTTLLRTEKPDVVVHCAAYRDPDFCERNPEEARRLNVLPARVMCEELPDEVPLVFVSSDYVFDGKTPPYDEDAAPSPVNVYGQSKVDAEHLVLGRDRGIVLRCPLLVGPGAGERITGFVAQILQAIRSGADQDLDDVLIRFPTFNRDVADAMAFLLERGQAGVFHASGAHGGTRYALTVQVARLLGAATPHLRPSKAVVPRVAARPRDSQLSTDKIRNLGFRQFTAFDEVVRSLLEAEDA